MTQNISLKALLSASKEVDLEVSAQKTKLVTYLSIVSEMLNKIVI
jgi:hypothetical protein